MIRAVVVAVAIALAGGCSTDSEQTAAPSSSSDSVAPTIDSSTTTTQPTPPTTPTTTTANTARITSNLSAQELAGELTAVERAAARGDADVGQRQQLLYRYLTAHSELDESVLAAVGDDIRPLVERIVRARQLGQARSAANPSPVPPSETLPAWAVVEPLPADELLADYRDAEATTGIAWYWLAAIHLQETRMGRIIGTSSAGAIGPMQFLPDTWARCCTGDPTVPHDAIVGAATYLHQSGGIADIQVALHEYNPNDSYVATVTAFAENMRDNPQLYNAYREWQVFYASAVGTIRLPIGYDEPQPIDAAAYLADHPGDLAA